MLANIWVNQVLNQPVSPTEKIPIKLQVNRAKQSFKSLRKNSIVLALVCFCPIPDAPIKFVQFQTLCKFRQFFRVC
ncbi:hypothetical protein AVDCRST_MAG84-2901 [uncultured Microcoleus sp.]|uniref:Uncharacterized protein n=1 Tax=uncultured Microcoleus sp. TaxID=259945 RepID=A0A6J4M934_9CYAN|nr:hypothetical protein AVDCRST_MAG84-2901 [uncultured Microcoleus sp.]